MNQVVVAPEVMERLHQLAEATHRSDAEVVDAALTSYLAADRHYVSVLAERIAAAERGEFVGDDELERFFADRAE